MPELVKWCCNMYHHQPTIVYDENHHLTQQQGGTQGVCLTSYYYSDTQNEGYEQAHQAMHQLILDYRYLFNAKYVDDTFLVMETRHVARFMEQLAEALLTPRLKLNGSKTQICVFDDSTGTITNKLLNKVAGLKRENVQLNCNIEYPGVHIVEPDFVKKYIADHTAKLRKKALLIATIKSQHIVADIYRKFMNYNKVNFLIRHTASPDSWINMINNLWELMEQVVLFSIDKNPCIPYQYRLSCRKGGLGDRAPIDVAAICRIAAHPKDEQDIEKPFRFYRNQSILDDSSIPHSPTAPATLSDDLSYSYHYRTCRNRANFFSLETRSYCVYNHQEHPHSIRLCRIASKKWCIHNDAVAFDIKTKG